MQQYSNSCSSPPSTQCTINIITMIMIMIFYWHSLTESFSQRSDRLFLLHQPFVRINAFQYHVLQTYGMHSLRGLVTSSFNELPIINIYQRVSRLSMQGWRGHCSLDKKTKNGTFANAHFCVQLSSVWIFGTYASCWSIWHSKRQTNASFQRICGQVILHLLNYCICIRVGAIPNINNPPCTFFNFGVQVTRMDKDHL